VHAEPSCASEARSRWVATVRGCVGMPDQKRHLPSSALAYLLLRPGKLL
jgi:hypothetical protein